jgi:hypothetical protein
MSNANREETVALGGVREIAQALRFPFGAPGECLREHAIQKRATKRMKRRTAFSSARRFKSFLTFLHQFF